MFNLIKIHLNIYWKKINTERMDTQSVSCFWCNSCGLLFYLFFFHFPHWYNPSFTAQIKVKSFDEEMKSDTKVKNTSEKADGRKLGEDALPASVSKCQQWTFKSICWGRSCDMIKSSTIATKLLLWWNLLKIFFGWFYKHMVHVGLSLARRATNLFPTVLTPSSWIWPSRCLLLAGRCCCLLSSVAFCFMGISYLRE